MFKKIKNWWKKFLIIIGIGAITVLATTNLGSNITSTNFKEVSSTIVTEVSNFHYFKNIDTGEVIKEEITDEEYKALGLKGAGQPEKEDYKWIGSHGGVIVATTTRVLLNYEYYNDGLDIISSPIASSSSYMIRIKISNKREKRIKKDCIVNKKLSELCLEN